MYTMSITFLMAKKNLSNTAKLWHHTFPGKEGSTLLEGTMVRNHWTYRALWQSNLQWGSAEDLNEIVRWCEECWESTGVRAECDNNQTKCFSAVEILIATKPALHLVARRLTHNILLFAVKGGNMENFRLYVVHMAERPYSFYVDVLIHVYMYHDIRHSKYNLG
jgi:hypothetical protein